LLLADIRARYPSFEGIFEKFIENTRFEDLPSRRQEFRALKLGVLSLWRLEDEHKRLSPATRSTLIRALLVERDTQRAFQIIQRRNSMFTRMLSTFWADSKEEEDFDIQMRTEAAKVSDSRFLQLLQSSGDEALWPTLQNAKALAQTELSTSLNTVVTNMTHTVLAMQQDAHGKDLRLQLANEERGLLRSALVEFIREINKKSTKGQSS